MQKFFGVMVLGFLSAMPFCAAEERGALSSSIDSSTLTMDVRGCVLMALENNRALSVERYGPEIEQTFVKEQQAFFDPALRSELSAAETKGQRTSGVGEFRGVSSRQKNLSVGISQQTPSGISYGIDGVVSSRVSNVYSQMFSTRLGTTLNVPILEGSGSRVNLVGIRQAEQNVELSKYELQGFILALAGDVEELYWVRRAAEEELRIRIASLELAWEQLRETRERIDVGAVPEIELVAAEGEVALREETVIDAESALKKTTLQLLQRLNPPEPRFWSMAVEQIESPTMEDTLTDSIEDHIAIAFLLRPDLNQARVQMEKRDLDIVKTRNGLLPRLDFFITFGKTGYADSFNDTIGGLDERNFDLNTGLLFEYSFGSRAKRARHDRAEFQLKEAQASLANFEQLVELDVRTSWIELDRTKRQIEATRVATRLQEAKYQAELEKFRVGKSTNLLVLVTQRDLIQSRLDEHRAQINWRIALGKLHTARGTLLDRYRIVLPTRPLPNNGGSN